MATVQDLLEGRDKALLTIAPNATVLEASKLMSQNKVGCVLIIKNEKLKGVFTERDLLNKVISADLDPATTIVKDVMTARVAVGNQDMDIIEAGELMSHNRIRHLPIVQDGEIVHVISTRDILAWKLQEHQTTVRHLENYFLT